MSELARRQQQFAEGLLGQSEAILPHIHSRLFTADAVLQVYRNHFILSLGEVLASSYPAVKAMVGRRFSTPRRAASCWQSRSAKGA